MQEFQTPELVTYDELVELGVADAVRRPLKAKLETVLLVVAPNPEERLFRKPLRLIKRMEARVVDTPQLTRANTMCMQAHCAHTHWWD